MKWFFLVSLAAVFESAACSDVVTNRSGPSDGGTTATLPDGAPAPGHDGSTDGGPPDVPTGDGAVPPPVHCDAAPTSTRGAALPYQEYEAEAGETNGAVLSPSRAVNDSNVFNSIAGESSARSAVKLTATGQYVRVKSACVTSTIVVRYVIPDSADGNGQDKTLGIYVDGTRVGSLALTSRYAWAYGGSDNSNATTNQPGDGKARHFYDEARFVFPTQLPAGATVTLQKDDSDTADYYVIDLVDFEALAGPAGQPANSLSIVDCGATPDDGGDDGVAIQKCINDAQAQGKSVWIPPGTFEDATTPLKAQGVTIAGAGMWYSTLHGASATFTCKGTHCLFANFSMNGETTLRDDDHSVHAMGGSFGTGSRVDNVWIEHYTTGPWIGVDGAPAASGLILHGCRFRDLYADGVNFCNGTSDSVVEQSHARNTGDDALASWAIGTSAPNTNNVFRFDTVQMPWKANCFAIYGGSNNAIEDSVCTDVVTYPGIMIDQFFSSNAFGGTTTITRDTILRGGGGAYGAKWGALTISGRQQASPIRGVQVQDVDIQDATFAGILISGPNESIDGLVLGGVNITHPGTFGIAVDPTAYGSANASNVVVTNPGAGAGLDNEAPGQWTFNRGAGNSGW